MSTQYKRLCQVLISTATEEIDVSQLRIAFEVQKDISNVANLAYIQIYNLKESTRAKIKDEFQGVSVSVGYGDSVSVLFSGQIRNVFHRRDEQDRTNIITELYCGDGDIFTRKSLSSRSSGDDKTLNQLVTELVSDLKDDDGNGVTVGEINIEGGDNKLKGITISSKTEDALNKLAASYRFNWFINSGKFYAVSETLTLQSQPITTITSTTGMINIPVLTEIGIDVKTLMNTSYAPGATIKIKSTATKVSLGTLFFDNVSQTIGEGTYKILRVTHTGDTRGNDWYSDIEAQRNWTSGGTVL